ncbi:hypothetical protein COCOBI_02-7790 [Coccomyxa sp. Obi]|nr:hypothetical protein COCOBI_02-7790 [Coccomyxa sp. Obi]
MTFGVHAVVSLVPSSSASRLLSQIYSKSLQPCVVHSTEITGSPSKNAFGVALPYLRNSTAVASRISPTQSRNKHRCDPAW